MNKFTKIVEDKELEPTPDQLVKTAWADDPKKDKYEFYHKMRTEGFDGEVIKSSVGIEIYNY